MSEVYGGSCLCGQSTYQATEKARFMVTCYCRDCQKVSGGGHLPQLAFPREAFETSGPIARYESRSDEGNALEFSFCSTCGSPLFKTTSKLSDLVVVTAGSLDDPSVFESQIEAFKASRLPWDRD